MARSVRQDTDCSDLWHAGGFREPDCVFESAQLSDFFCRDGRGARWPVHASRRLRITLPTMGNGTAQSRSEAQAGRSGISGGERRYSGLAGCAGANFMAGKTCELFESSRSPVGPSVHVVRALSV